MSLGADARPEQVVARLRQGDRRALARAITWLEDGCEAARELLALVYPHGGNAHVVGVTGAPGTGKSTLINALARQYRQRGLTVGILAVDPTSPFTGGALLGDRLRMRDLSGDVGVFIRSMATRGASGGVSRVAADAVQVLDAARYDRILVETVGAGQDEVQVARVAHTVVVVEAPGLGDEIQAIKAGILETASVLVVNKADRDGAEQTIAALRMMLELTNPNPDPVAHHGRMMAAAAPDRTCDAGGWEPPLLATVATEGGGVDAVLSAIESHRAYLAESGQWASVEMRRAEAQLNSALDAAWRRLLAERVGAAAYRRALERILKRSTDPHTAAEWLLEHLGDGP